jgi:hypothetical protein
LFVICHFVIADESDSTRATTTRTRRCRRSSTITC